MESTYPPEQDALILRPDTFSLVSLVEQGLNCIEQRHHVDAAAFFRLACERLCSDQVQLATTLDALSKALMSYMHAQQELHEASKRFAEFDIEQQAQIEALKKLLPTVVEDTLPVSSTGTRLRKNPGGNQSLRLLRIPASTTDHPERHQTSLPDDQNTLPPLYITCFGQFEVRHSDPSSHPISLCTNLKGQTILRYLIAQPKYRETVDILMGALWPAEASEVALHKLRVAISALRCSLNRDYVSEPGGGYILCKDQVYQLNPLVQLHTDVDEFLALYQAGQKASDRKPANLYYEQACQLYSGPFLAEDLYADWPYNQREELSKIYVVMCDKLAEFNLEAGCYEVAAKWASAILKVDRCDEEAHRQLIRAYAVQGRRSGALQQYQHCQRILAVELGVQPMPETQKLFHMLLNSEDLSTLTEKIGHLADPALAESWGV